MNKRELDKLIELEKVATPVMAVFERGNGFFREYEIRDPNGVLFRSTSYGKMKEDAEFIAAARNSLPKLLKERAVLVEALKAIRETDACIAMEDRGCWNYQFKASEALREVGEIE